METGVGSIMISGDGPMRVLQLVEASSAGVGCHVIELTTSLLDRGHEVHLIYSRARIDDAFQNGLDRLREIRDFHAFEIPMVRRLDWSDISAIAALRQYVKREGPFDMVHCHSTKAGFLGRIGLLGTGAPRVYTPHALFTMKKSGGTVRAAAILAERILAFFCERIILVSEEECKHAQAIGVPAKLLEVIRPGIPVSLVDNSRLHRVELRAREGLKSSDICIGFV